MRHLFSNIAKRLYKDQFLILSKRIDSLELRLDSILGVTDTEILIQILISGEDHRFKYHFGFDIIAILRAIKNRLIYGRVEGASTIEQQLVRVLLNRYEKTFSRKICEILLSTTLCELIPRKKIPMVYLAVAYYGANMNGLHQVLAKLSPNKLDIIDENLAAEIVSRIKYPEPKKYNEYRETQIKRRKSHLIKLYHQHKSRKYLPLYD